MNNSVSEQERKKHNRRMKKIRQWVAEAEDYREKHCQMLCADCGEDCDVPTLKQIWEVFF